jgi:DNA-binding CsgD family transcriptional regulator
LTVIEWARAVLLNGVGRYDEATTVARDAGGHPNDLSASSWALSELAEAATRSGQTELAVEAVERLSGMTRASGTDWALGIEARSRALVSDGDVADGLYREAIDRLERTRVVVELARACLLYGEWLRRERRRLDARLQLRQAHELFSAVGAEAFGERAARELLATGERVRKRTSEMRGQLTAQEAQVARLARDGLSNQVIAAQLFISPRTVEYHLHKVFTKLAISSRAQLKDALGSEAREPQPV